MSVRDDIKSLSPTWLKDDSAAGVGGKFMYTIGLACDAVMDKVWQGISARMPKYANPTALPYLGTDRLIVRGLNQSDKGYATHLQQAFDDWQIAGTGWGVLKESLWYVAPETGPLPFAYAISPKYAIAQGASHPIAECSFLFALGHNYYDLNTSSISLGLPYNNYPASNTSKPPQLIEAGFDWDSLSQGTIGYRLDETSGFLRNYWRWFLILSGCFDQFGQYITTVSNTSPISITTHLPHGLSTGEIVSIEVMDGSPTGTASNSGGLILVTTVSPHGLHTGNKVLLSTFQSGNGSYSGQGYWTITVTGTNTYTLDGSVYPGYNYLFQSAFVLYSARDVTITVTGANTFTVDGSTTAGTFPPTLTWNQLFARVYRTASNTWVDRAPFKFGDVGVKIGQRPDASIGLNLPPSAITTLRGIMDLWKSGESLLDTMIISFSPSYFGIQAEFNPNGVWQPDGRFGRWSRIVANQYVPSRLPHARYCSGVE